MITFILSLHFGDALQCARVHLHVRRAYNLNDTVRLVLSLNLHGPWWHVCNVDICIPSISFNGVIMISSAHEYACGQIFCRCIGNACEQCDA